MGIQINGNTDTISAIDGGLTVSGASLGSASASSLNISGIVTSSGGFSGNVTGNITGNVLGNITGNISASGVSTFSGGVVVSAGSTSSPSISPSGDSNTGIFFPSPDTVAIAEGGVEALRVDSNGNIGVNTISTNPLGNGGTFKNLTVFTPGGYAVFGGISDLTASGSTIAAFNAGTLGASSVKNAASINVELDGTSTTNATGRIVFYTAASGSVTEKARITSTGNVQIANGNLVFSTAGTGIDFSATANSSGTMTSELLSDYEEGTWSPTFIGESGVGNPTVTYSVQLGRYVKIGQMVYASGNITLSAVSGTGTTLLQIGGWPFTVGPSVTSDRTTVVDIGLANNWTTASPTRGYLREGQIGAYLTTISGTTLTFIRTDHLQSSSSLYFKIVYTTSQ